jgi:ribonuclease-3
MLKTKKKFSFKIKKIIGFKPKNLELYNHAFTHKSATLINHVGEIINNERLEFLGDAILDAIISDILYKKFKNFDEGKLTQTRSKLVNTNQLSFYAKKLKLTDFLVVRTSNKLNQKHLYADSFEAFIGAIYLDKGFKKTYKFIEKKIISQLTNLQEVINTEINHKSRLLELSQRKNFAVIFNTKENTTSSENFISTVIIDGKENGTGFGRTKKEAEQNAALKTLKKLNPDYNNAQKNNKNKD